MPEFDTPEPITVTIDLGPGDVHLTATDRTDTVVEVRPTDESDDSDVKAAKQVRVEFADGTLQITGPKIRAFDFSKRTRSVTVTIGLPAGSRLNAKAQIGDLRTTGELSECTVKTGAGHVHVGRVTGGADINTSSGRVHLGEAGGTVVVKNSNGDTDVDDATGELRIRCSNGEITIGGSAANVDAKTSNGSVTVRAARGGSLSLKSANGEIEVGVEEGVAAWLDVHTSFGRLRNELAEPAAAPGAAEATVEVRAETSLGDITIRRA